MNAFPTRIYLTGFMGSGKSTIGPLLAARLGYSFLDLDALIEARVGKPVSSLFAEDGEVAFRALEAALLRETTRQEHVVVALGGGALTFEENLSLARASGGVVYLRVSPMQLARRLATGSEGRPLLKGADGQRLSGVSLQAKIEAMLVRREAFYRRAHVTVEATWLGVETTVEAVVQALEAGYR